MPIRLGTRDDVVETCRLDQALYGEDAWTYERICRVFDSGALQLVVATVSDLVVGHANAVSVSPAAFYRLLLGAVPSTALEDSDVAPSSGYWWIGSVSVESEHQKKGLGRELFQTINERVEGEVIADVWSPGGSALVAGEPRWLLAHSGPYPVWRRRA